MTAETFAGPDLGALAAALARAQTQFPVITRDKQVTVQTKTGGSYSFKYAPLDSILDKVRAPLAANGLAIVQMLDEGGLTTTLLHESGASLSGHIAFPPTQDIQGLGSAVTYLRRYAIQAVLGIAAEEDDDGNRAAGNRIIAADVEHTNDGGLIGIAQVGDKQTSDFLVRQTPEGPEIGFRLRGQKGGILVEAVGPLAAQLDEHRSEIVDQRVTVWGRIGSRSLGKGKASYQVLDATRVRVPGLGDLPVDAPADAPAEEPQGITEAESEAIWAELQAVAGA